MGGFPRSKMICSSGLFPATAMRTRKSAASFFSHKFDDDTPKFSFGHKLTLDDVTSWVTKTGGHDSRITWFTVNAPRSPFFLEIAKPLLSVRITGSITVERVAKFIKNSILTKNRNKTGTVRAEMQLRAGLNLRFLYDAKEHIRKKEASMS